MEKEALLTYGSPEEGENKSHFDRFIKTNLKIMEDIAIHNGYSIKIKPIIQIDPSFNQYNGVKDFLFYYTGHSTFFKNVPNPILEIFPLDNLIRSIEKLSAKKKIFLDACSDTFIENYSPSENTSIAGAFDMPYDSTLAMSLYDAIYCRGKNLEELSQETFNEMRHNWIKFKNNLGKVA